MKDNEVKTLSLLPKIDEKEFKAIKNAIEPKANDVEIMVFLGIAQKYGLDPFTEMNLILNRNSGRWGTYVNKAGLVRKAAEKGIIVLQSEIEKCKNPLTGQDDFKVIASFLVQGQELKYHIYASEYTSLYERNNWKNFKISMLYTRAEVVGLRKLVALPLYTTEEMELVWQKEKEITNLPPATRNLSAKRKELPAQTEKVKEEIVSEQYEIKEEQLEEIEEEPAAIKKTEKIKEEKEMKITKDENNILIVPKKKEAIDEKKEVEQKSIPEPMPIDIDEDKPEWREILKAVNSISLMEDVKKVMTKYTVLAFRLGTQYGKEFMRLLKEKKESFFRQEKRYEGLTREEVIEKLAAIMKSKYRIIKPSILDLFIEEGEIPYQDESEIPYSVLLSKLEELENANT